MSEIIKFKQDETMTPDEVVEQICEDVEKKCEEILNREPRFLFNDIFDRILIRYFESAGLTLDMVDCVGEKTLNKITKGIYKEYKRSLSAIRKSRGIQARDLKKYVQLGKDLLFRPPALTSGAPVESTPSGAEDKTPPDDKWDL